MTTVPGLYALGEANFSEHGANRLGASALMQGLADGYFVLPYTIADYLADDIRTGKISTELPEFETTEKEVEERITKLMSIQGTKTADHFHRRLGKVMWDKVGMSRDEEGLKWAIAEIQKISSEFYQNLRIPVTDAPTAKEMSIPPAISTTNRPTAQIRFTALLFSSEVRFTNVRNCGEAMDKKAHSSASTASSFASAG
jgi:succinate dehydrogenase / fumarate reductase flavoprotein subunit